MERRLALIIVAGLLPLAVLALLVLLREAQLQKQELLESDLGTMRAISSAVDSELESTIASLDALAASPRLAANDFMGLHAEARELLARRPTWANIVLSDLDADQLMNARLAPGTPLPKGTYAQGIRETARTGKPVVGDVIYSPVLSAYGFAVQIPIRRNGVVTQVLSAILRPEAIREIIGNVAEEGVVGVTDNAYNVVARTLNQEQTVGRPAAADFRALLAKGRRSGWAETSTLEGMKVYSVFHRSSLSGWTVGLGIPASLVGAPVRRSYLFFGGLIAASVLIGVIAAFLVSRAITKPMRELKLAAEAMGAGAAPTPPDTDLPEIRGVAAALVAAHAEREKLLAIERNSREVEREARLAAERTNKLKDEFLAMLGHELRNPVAAISSASLVLEVAAGDPDARTAVQEATAIVRRQTRHLARLTDDLLDAGRAVLGRIQLNRTPVDLAEIVQNVLDTTRTALGLGSHSVTASLSSAWINGDTTRIEQIVSNLLVNAVKYTPAAGSIDIRVERSGNWAVFKVRDSGIGIEPDLMPRIFDLFVQGTRSPDRPQGGLGIGLTMVRRLAELHDGGVQATSSGTGLGSEFTVSFPAIEAPPQSASNEFLPEVQGPLSIAIVEDNPDVRAALRHLLELSGHKVTEAADGHSAIETIARLRPDVAFVDIGLPVIDGLGVARALRARAETHSLYLVALSGYGAKKDRQIGLRAGFDDYLVKPVDPKSLDAVLRKASARSSGTRTGSTVVSFRR